VVPVTVPEELMVMQQVMRPYATAGIALVGASMIAVTPIAAPLPQLQMRPVTLVDAWSDLVSETTTNLQHISSAADPTQISEVFSALGTNPLGVIGAFFNLTPTVDASIGTLPATVDIQLPPGLELLLAQIGAEGAAFNAINDVVAQLATNPSGAFNTLLEAPATILNAFLNGEDNISLLNGTIDIAGFNGILAPLQDVSINLNLVNLLDALGLGNLDLTSLQLSDLLSQIGLGNVDLGGLIDALGLNATNLDTLLGNPTLGGLLGDLGLGDLGLGSLSLTNLLGLDGNINLDNLGLDTVLGAFGIDGNVTGGLTGLVNALLGSSAFTNEGLGSLLSTLPASLINGILGPLNSTLGTMLNPLLNIVGLGPLLSAALNAAGLNFNSLLNATNLEAALDHVHISDLLGGQSINESVSSLLTALHVTVPDGLNLAGILEGLGLPDSTGALTLSDLLGGLDIGNLPLTDLLSGLDLGDLLNGLGLSDIPLDLSNLGDLGTLPLNLGDLLTDLGLDGNLATITVEPFGGLLTELVDVVPQQILTALGI
jgi:hypothetical protein